MTYHFDPQALAEYGEAVDHYAQIRPQLAEEFVAEVESAISGILDHPCASPTVGKHVRRHLVRRFPFGIFYRLVDDDTILIVAVGHLSRRPRYWRRRLPEP